MGVLIDGRQVGWSSSYLYLVLIILVLQLVSIERSSLRFFLQMLLLWRMLSWLREVMDIKCQARLHIVLCIELLNLLDPCCQRCIFLLIYVPRLIRVAEHWILLIDLFYLIGWSSCIRFTIKAKWRLSRMRKSASILLFKKSTAIIKWLDETF